MVQPVNLVRVFIASPSDVIAERDAAVQVTNEMNAAHSFEWRVSIEAVRMETHAQAALGAHPQQLINGQLLGRCDLLVAVFWSRLGSPTPNAVSGTVEEIMEFSEQKGAANVLLFFADRGYPQGLDTKELGRLRKFKEEMHDKGLYISFGSVEDFREKLRHQLELRVLQFAMPEGVLVTHATPMVTLESDGAGTRIDDFRSLRTRAQRSMYVMGVGMTLFAQDVTLMQALLAKGLAVRLLMIDPEVIASSRSRRARSDSPAFSIMEDSFSDFFAKKGYGNAVRSSFCALQELEATASGTASAGRVELRKYPFFLPLNFTAIDEGGSDGSILLEFCLPFSDQRLRMLISRKRDPEVFLRVIDNCEKLWKRSAPAACAVSNSALGV